MQLVKFESEGYPSWEVFSQLFIKRFDHDSPLESAFIVCAALNLYRGDSTVVEYTRKFDKYVPYLERLDSKTLFMYPFINWLREPIIIHYILQYPKDIDTAIQISCKFSRIYRANGKKRNNNHINSKSFKKKNNRLQKFNELENKYRFNLNPESFE